MSQSNQSALDTFKADLRGAIGTDDQPRVFKPLYEAFSSKALPLPEVASSLERIAANEGHSHHDRHLAAELAHKASLAL